MKFSFKENKLVFDWSLSDVWGKVTKAVGLEKPADTPQAAQSPQSAPEGQPKPPEAPQAPAAAAETKKALAGVQTEVQLSALKETVEELKVKMQNDFEEFGNAISLNGQEVGGVLSGDLDFNFLKQSLTDAVLKLLAGKDLTKFVEKLNAATGLNVKKEEVDNAIAAIYANSIIAAAEGKFKKDFARYKDFVKYQKEQTPPKTYEIPFKVKITGITGFAPEFTTSGFVADYEAYNKAVPASTEKPKKEESIGEQELAEVKDAKAKALRSSFAGMILLRIGIIDPGKGPEGETDAEKAVRENAAYLAVLDGSNPIAKWVIYLLGGSALLNGGGADVEAAIADMGEKGKIFKVIKEKGSASFISLEGTAKKYGGTEGQVEGGAKEMNSTEFAEVLADPKKMPEKGLKLKEAVVLKASEKLRINLKNGGEMVIPKGGFVRTFDGPQKGDAQADTPLKDVDFAIIGQLPVGTTFNGKAELKIEELTAAV